LSATVKPEQVLRGSRETAFSCLYYAVMNLFVWAGTDPPSFERMQALITQTLGETAARVDEPEDRAEWSGIGLNLMHALALLHEFEFPRLAALTRIPKRKTARDLFPRLLDTGHGILFSVRMDFTGPDAGYNMSHALVACGWSDEWVEVMDSNPPGLSGRLIPYVDDGSYFGPTELDASLTAPPHGAVTRYGWQTVEEDAPLQQNGDLPRGLVGIDRMFLLALPKDSEV
jgi:hypothetical protein